MENNFKGAYAATGAEWGSQQLQRRSLYRSLRPRRVFLLLVLFRWGLGICESDMGLGTRDSEVSGREKETHGVSGGWRGTVRKMGGGVCNGNTEGGLVASDCQWLTTTDRTPRTTFITGTPPLLIWLLIWLAK